MKRRAFIGATIALATGAAWGPAIAHATMDRVDVTAAGETAALVDHLLLAFPQRQSLQVIGRAYRRSLKDSIFTCRACMPDAFQDFLRHLELSKSDLQAMTPSAMRRCIDAGTARDFSEGRIISVDGWLLGETEARLCEIAALRRS